MVGVPTMAAVIGTGSYTLLDGSTIRTAYPFVPATEIITREDIFAGYRQLIARAHKKGIRVVGTTIPPFEGATFVGAGLNLSLYTAEREKTRHEVNEWILHSGKFDGVLDFDKAVRDPARPAQLASR